MSIHMGEGPTSGEPLIPGRAVHIGNRETLDWFAPYTMAGEKNVAHVLNCLN